MSQTLVTLNDGQRERSVIFANLNTNQVFDQFIAPKTSNEADVIEDFVQRTGVVLTVETPNSSWIERAAFNAIDETLTFFTNDGSEVPFPATFSDFQELLQAASAGKFYHKLRKEVEAGTR